MTIDLDKLESLARAAPEPSGHAPTPEETRAAGELYIAAKLYMPELLQRLRAAESAMEPCTRDLCGHAAAEHDGGRCGAGVEGEMGWIRCGCESFVRRAVEAVR